MKCTVMVVGVYRERVSECVYSSVGCILNVYVWKVYICIRRLSVTIILEVPIW
jgi:hypothetical protein